MKTLNFAVSFFSNFLFSRWLLVLCLNLVPLLLFVQKNLTYSLIRSLHSRGYGNEKVLIYGSGYTGRRVFSVLRRSPKLGLEPVVFVDDDPSKAGTVVFETGYERRSSAPIAPGPLDRNLISRFGVDLVIVAIPSIGLEKFVRTIEEALGANARISFVPSHLLPSDPWVDYQDIDGVLLASFGRSSRMGYDIVKRVCDFAGSLLLMVVGLPIFLLLALIIRLDSPGPILFRQERVGHNGELFKMFKFRTMHASAPAYEYSPRASDDSRITRVGRFLRRTSLDELPQLLNVLQGKMSLVGPRPEMPFIAEQYTARQAQRLHSQQPGEIVFVGAGRVAGEEASVPAAPPNLRFVPITSPAEHAGLRKVGVRRSVSDPDIWEVFITVKNYGATPRSVPLGVQFGGAPRCVPTKARIGNVLATANHGFG